MFNADGLFANDTAFLGKAIYMNDQNRYIYLITER